MYDDNLIDAISRIDDKYLNEYMSRKLAAYGGNKKTRTRPFVKWLAVAAACVVVVGIAFVIASIAKKESLSKMTAYSGVHLFTDGQDLYFTSPDMKLMKYCIDDGSLEPVKDETSEWYYTLQNWKSNCMSSYDDKLYYCPNQSEIHCMNMDGSEDKIVYVTDETIEQIYWGSETAYIAENGTESGPNYIEFSLRDNSMVSKVRAEPELYESLLQSCYCFDNSDSRFYLACNGNIISYSFEKPAEYEIVHSYSKSNVVGGQMDIVKIGNNVFYSNYDIGSSEGDYYIASVNNVEERTFIRNGKLVPWTEMADQIVEYTVGIPEISLASYTEAVEPRNDRVELGRLLKQLDSDGVMFPLYDGKNPNELYYNTIDDTNTRIVVNLILDYDGHSQYIIFIRPDGSTIMVKMSDGEYYYTGLTADYNSYLKFVK